MKKIRLIIADKREVYLQGLIKIFEKEKNIELVAICTTENDTINKAIELKPDVLLLSGNMVMSDGIDITQNVREFAPDIRIVINNSITDDPSKQLSSLYKDAFSYVDEDIDAQRLIDHINHAYRGIRVLSPRLGGILLNELSFSKQEAKTEEKGLSLREKEVLALVSKGLANKEIAARLFITDNTVKVHMSDIFKKLRVHNRHQAALKGGERNITRTKSES